MIPTTRRALVAGLLLASVASATSGKNRKQEK